jgi:hypothetical protein
MVAAAISLLLASGRSDFTEREILAEVERLTATLRSHYAFTEAESSEALDLWLRVRPTLRRNLEPATWHGWLKPLRPVGLVGDRLWLTGRPDRGFEVEWCRRRYSALIDRAIAAVGGDAHSAFLGIHPNPLRQEVA